MRERQGFARVVAQLICKEMFAYEWGARGPASPRQSLTGRETPRVDARRPGPGVPAAGQQ